MCRPGGRRCPSHSDPVKIAARNKRRREKYAATKTLNQPTHNKPETLTLGLSEDQQNYFAKSHVKHPDGTPITVYHGSAVEFNSFDPNTVGRGNDSWGNGFYFTDQEQVAKGYAIESGSPTANVKSFYLNLENPLYVDGKENMSLNNITFTPEQALKILKAHPDAYLQPEEENNDRTSFLSDYSPKYWDKEHHTKEELDTLIEEVAQEYFNDDTSWVNLESLYGKENGAAFLRAVHDTTGNDGVIVDFGEDGKHYVAWFPEQMKLTTNVKPEKNNIF